MFTIKNPLQNDEGGFDKNIRIICLFIVSAVVGSFLGDMDIMRM